MNYPFDSRIEEEGEDGDAVRRGPWTPEEDALLVQYISCHGEGRWNLLAKCSGLRRTGKSCRLRWLNYLKPDIKRGNLTPQEQLLILELHSKWGNRWSKIAQHLPGRTDNEIKNYWRTRVQKHAKQLNMECNSQGFIDAIRCFYMPRLVEKIEQDYSVILSSSTMDFDHPSVTSTPPPSSSSSSFPQQDSCTKTPFSASNIVDGGCPHHDINFCTSFKESSTSSHGSPSSTIIMMSPYETSKVAVSNPSHDYQNPVINNGNHSHALMVEDEKNILLPENTCYYVDSTSGYEMDQEMVSIAADADAFAYNNNHGWSCDSLVNDTWSLDSLW